MASFFRGKSNAPYDPVAHNLGKQLIHYCFRGDEKKVKDLIAKGADVNYKNCHGETPIYAASAAGWLQGVEFLVSKGGNLKCRTASDQDCVHAASACGSEELLSYLHQKGLSLTSSAYDGSSPLHIAVRMGQARLIPWLVRNKVSPNIEDINGFTPFHRAAEIVGRRICMELLWDAGSKVNSLTVKGDTVLHVAAKRGDRDTMKWLIEHGGKLHCYGCEKGRPCENIENQTLKWMLEEFERYKKQKKDIKKKLEDEKKKRKEEEKTKDWSTRSKEITDRMQMLQVEDKQRRRLSISKKA